MDSLLIQRITPERWRFLQAWYDLPARIGYQDQNGDGDVDLTTELVNIRRHRPLDLPTKTEVISKIKGDVWNEATWRRFAPTVAVYTAQESQEISPFDPFETGPVQSSPLPEGKFADPFCPIRIIPVERGIEYKIRRHEAKGSWEIPKIESRCRPQPIFQRRLSGKCLCGDVDSIRQFAVVIKGDDIWVQVSEIH